VKETMCSVAAPAHPRVSISVNTGLLPREAASPSLKVHARSSSLQRAMTRAPRTRARYTTHTHTCATHTRAGTARVRVGRVACTVHRHILRARLNVRVQVSIPRRGVLRSSLRLRSPKSYSAPDDEDGDGEGDSEGGEGGVYLCPIRPRLDAPHSACTIGRGISKPSRQRLRLHSPKPHPRRPMMRTASASDKDGMGKGEGVVHRTHARTLRRPRAVR
jgi:hypothetical protein